MKKIKTAEKVVFNKEKLGVLFRRGISFGVFQNPFLDFVQKFFIFFEFFANVIKTGAKAFAFETITGAGFGDNTSFEASVHHVGFIRNSFAVHNVEFGLAERRGDLVFDDFGFDAGADNLITLFNLGNAANVDADGGVKFKSFAAGGGFGIAKHHTDLHPDLVDEDDESIRFGGDSSEFAQSLRHHTSLKADELRAHLAFDFGARS